jgi:hypothetical protein
MGLYMLVCIARRSRIKGRIRPRKKIGKKRETYISALLSLELSDTLIGSRGISTQLQNEVSINGETRPIRRVYLGERRRKAGGHTWCPQTLAGGRNEISSGNHDDKTPRFATEEGYTESD